MNESLVKKGALSGVTSGCHVTYSEQMAFELSTASHGKKTPSAPTIR